MTDSFQQEKSPNPEALFVQSMDLEGQGVSHDPQGRVVFIENALPFEWVKYQATQRKAKWSKGMAVEHFSQSHLRIKPECENFGFDRGSCGGCKIQHVHPLAQISLKQRSLIDQLWHLGKCRPSQLLRPLTGPSNRYRHRGRLSVRYVEKRDEVLIGFHERSSRYIADMQNCWVIPESLSKLLLPLRALIHGLKARQQIPQIEFAQGTHALALVLRHLYPLDQNDLNAIKAFASCHGVQWWLQSAGPDSAMPIEASPDASLSYEIPEFDLEVPFAPTDFTQVNPQINQRMIQQAINLMGVKSSDTVIDWFCGLGNFTLPLATLASHVLGIEGSPQLIHRAKKNWLYNQERRIRLGMRPLSTIDYSVKNLFDFSMDDLVSLPYSRLWLWDPPREGAFALTKSLSDLNQTSSGAWMPPEKIVYVSCNPSTLARDAGLLVHQAGYRCTHAGVMDMFPHTAHVESLAVFERN